MFHFQMLAKVETFRNSLNMKKTKKQRDEEPISERVNLGEVINRTLFPRFFCSQRHLQSVEGND